VGITDSSLRVVYGGGGDDREAKEGEVGVSETYLYSFPSSASWHDFRDLEGRNGGCGVGLIVVVKACIAVNAASL
jgi:hypothetical protein